ncbi:hypothetical protein [Leisingera methylohalidivorans]|uniref:Uncharacterized protein n=1 Tax=Leisingera methylohalidivorans DSM 14336 TaxID=999552 RepID=V9W1E6_9RHOB|nr:hypothetical protein [Leisingera methylohalidivorans]AHD02997.1 hypothetical protein METH_08060 [Leisingera methylohalidivorans DSM 14336]
MAETTQHTGRLGLESRDTGTLSAAVAAVVDTLEDFGHPAETIAARAENTARLQCDHYHVTVRLRRVPLRRSSKLTSSIMQPSALLELSLSPVFPGYCDQEISELLLAEMLRRLLPEVDATYVEWLETGTALTCEQFLGVFTAGNGQPEQRNPPIVGTANALASQPRQTGRASLRGRERFTPVEQTALELEAHCDRVFQAANRSRGRKTAPAGFARLSWGSQLRASALAAVTLAGTRRLRFISHLLLLTALFLFLESAGMVQAARPLLP